MQNDVVRYPVILKSFHLNKGTGGEGTYHGGDGVVRKIVFRTPLIFSILSERRVFQPYGLRGGMPGARGENLIIRASGQVQDIGGKASIDVLPGVSPLICTLDFMTDFYTLYPIAKHY